LSNTAEVSLARRRTTLEVEPLAPFQPGRRLFYFALKESIEI
jgi:hypothetical protein